MHNTNTITQYTVQYKYTIQIQIDIQARWGDTNRHVGEKETDTWGRQKIQIEKQKYKIEIDNTN